MKPVDSKRKAYELAFKRGYTLMVDSTPVREHIKLLHQYMTYREIGRRAGLPESTVLSHRDTKDHPRIMRVTADKLLAVQPGPNDFTYEERRRGAERIVQGLVYAGFTYHYIAQSIGLDRSSIDNKISRCDDNWTNDQYLRLRSMAGKLEHTDPYSVGITARGVKVNRSTARGKKWAPLACWDLDEVHREDIIPQWTGVCGTVEGRKIHYRDRIVPPCNNCRTADMIYRRYPNLARLMGAIGESSGEEAA